MQNANRQQLFLVEENNNDHGETTTWRSVFTTREAAMAEIEAEANRLVNDCYGETHYEPDDSGLLTGGMLACNDGILDPVVTWDIETAEVVA